MRTFAQQPKAAQQTTSAKPTIPVRAHFGQSHEVNSILHLQRTIGNHAVQRLLQNNAEERNAVLLSAASPHFGHDFSQILVGPPTAGAIQTKLAINRPGDEYEQEADRVAEQVMRMPEPRLQRACACGGACPKCQTERHSHIHERVQAPHVGSGDLVQSAVPPPVNEVLTAPGQPLDSGTQGFMESRFGHDFSQVRVHTGGAAEQSSRALNARAYTVGNNIVFGVSQFAPGTSEGRKLLAHELTHVVQQTGAGGQKIDRSNASFGLSHIGVHPLIQRDLAIEPPRPAAVGRVLTPAQMAAAIAFNNRVLGSIANSADIIEMIRDVIGIPPLPAVVDEDFVNGVVQWQANFGLTQDGQLGPATARPLFREIGAEGVGRGEVSRPPRYTPTGPINVARAGARTAHFDMAAEFRSDPRNGIFPSCCEVRQDIQWDAAFVAASAAAGTGAVPHGGFPAAHPANTWIEDRDPTGTRRLGHRSGRFSEGIPGNRYLDSAGRPNQAFGHQYEGSDDPSGFATDRGSWSFRLRVIDVCNGNRQLVVSPTLVLNWL
jgi:Domain of unknown function (DUF4157)